MKHIITVLFLGLSVLFTDSLMGQIKTPAASQMAKLTTTVGLTDITLEYSRPSRSGRKIYGELVPFDAMWRTGANKNSMISFSDDVMIGGSEVKKGTYAIFTKPGKTSWEVYFYSDTENWGVPEKWDNAKVAAKVMVTPVSVQNVETFTLEIANVSYNDCYLELNWETTSIPVKIDVPTVKKVTSSITSVMGGPSANDYSSAARYYRESKIDLSQALVWMKKAVDMGNDKYWHLRQLSLIEADLGNYKDAIETAKKSLDKAKEAGNQDYVKMNNDSIAEWSKKK
ncbi:MAG: DUF2911 domain-containing protein [Saprospiraceae bacterium]|jgi:hypothetical protein|nr:DUF2911 domain-containing protein [Saprospiraceae bacterium]